jgi:hypothetical protein
MPEADILSLCANLTTEYPEMVSPQFPSQFVHAVSFLRKGLSETMSIKPFSEFRLAKYSCLESQFSGIYHLLVFFTLPVTLAGAGRPFIKIKVIKAVQKKFDRPNQAKWPCYIGYRAQKAARTNNTELINNLQRKGQEEF